MKKILIFMIISCLLLSTAIIASDELEISDITGWVDGDKDSMSGGSLDNVLPGSTIKIEIEFRNNFDDVTDNDIEDIEVTATLKDIEDEGSDDIELDDEIDKIRTEDEDSIKFTFEIPLEVDEGSYDLIIEAEGEDQNGTKFSVTNTYDIEIEKESHELRFYRTDLASSTMCSGLASLSVGLMNTGTNDEDVVLTVINGELGINEEVKFNLDDNPYDRDSKRVTNFDLRIPDGAKEKSHSLAIQATYSSRKVTEMVNLVIKCDTPQVVTPVKTTTTVAKPVVTTTATTPSVVTTTARDVSDSTVRTTSSSLPETQYVKTTSYAKNEGSSGNISFTLIFVLLEILIVVALVFGIVYYKRNK